MGNTTIYKPPAVNINHRLLCVAKNGGSYVYMSRSDPTFLKLINGSNMCFVIIIIIMLLLPRCM